MSGGQIFAIYTVLLYGAFATIIGFAGSHGGSAGAAGTVVALVLPPVLGGCAVVVHRWLGEGSGMLLTGGLGAHRPRALLSKARSLLLNEKWQEARDELEEQWARFPGDGEVVSAFERCLLDGFHAPSGFAEFLTRALPQLAGEDKAYAYWRLAELSVDHLGAKQDARMWCRRIEIEFPGSPRVEQARALLAKLPAPGPGSADGPASPV